MIKRLQGVYGPGSQHWVGDGFHVQNFFPSNELTAAVSPFLLMDYAGPTDFEAGSHRHGVDRHPHRGFETVTVAYQGDIEHSDSAGHSGVIAPGDVQWMTAGSGVVHEEKQSAAFAERGGTLEMVQLWLNLRRVDKMTPPKYQTLAKADIPVVPIGGGTARVIAGSLLGESGPASTFSPVTLIDLSLPAGGVFETPWTEGHTASLLIRKGAAVVEGQSIEERHLVVWERVGDALRFEAAEPFEGLLLGGEPIDEPTFFHGPFVMNSPQELSQAIADYRAGKMG